MITAVSDELNAPNELDEVEHHQEQVGRNATEQVSRVPGRRVDTRKSDKLPNYQHHQPETQHDEERNVEEQNRVLLEEEVGVSQENRSQLQLLSLAEDIREDEDSEYDQCNGNDNVPSVALESHQLDRLHQQQDRSHNQRQRTQHEHQVTHNLRQQDEQHQVQQSHPHPDRQRNQHDLVTMHRRQLRSESRVVPEISLKSLVGRTADQT